MTTGDTSTEASRRAPPERTSPCLVCGAAFRPFMSFGRQPIANGFLLPAHFADEFFFELTVGICPQCSMVQLGELVDESKLFHEAYAFFSGTSRAMAEHFREFASAIADRNLASVADPFVVEIGSNDGIMLKNFAAAGTRHLGVEPSANVADVARSQGIRTISRFFDERLAAEILAEHGPADAILAANVICHIPYLHSVFRGVRALLRPSGVFVFEEPYLGDIVEKASYDQIYDEHVFYFCVLSLQRTFATHDMEIVDVEPQDVHGGSMRYTVRRRGAGPASAAVATLLARERAAGLDRPETFDRLRERVERSRTDLVALLRRVKAEGKRVVGYGATSKSTVVTNYCGITDELCEFISDTTPIKQGKYSPGTHIPVKPHAEFQARPPDYALLFAWNHAREIMRNEEEFIARGGRFITYIPKVGFAP